MKQSVSIIREQLGLSAARKTKTPEAQPTVTAARGTLFGASAQPPAKRLGVVGITEMGELTESPFYGTYARRVPTSSPS
jgi:hypothetical protein